MFLLFAVEVQLDERLWEHRLDILLVARGGALTQLLVAHAPSYRVSRAWHESHAGPVQSDSPLTGLCYRFEIQAVTLLCGLSF